jgi:hypothetical protein
MTFSTMHFSFKWKKGRLPAPMIYGAFSFVIPDPKAVIPAPDQVRGFNIRDPVPHESGLRVVARNDKDRRPQ